MEQQLSSLTAAIINSDLNLHKPGTINSFMMDNAPVVYGCCVYHDTDCVPLLGD